MVCETKYKHRKINNKQIFYAWRAGSALWMGKMSLKCPKLTEVCVDEIGINSICRERRVGGQAPWPILRLKELSSLSLFHSQLISPSTELSRLSSVDSQLISLVMAWSIGTSSVLFGNWTASARFFFDFGTYQRMLSIPRPSFDIESL